MGDPAVATTHHILCRHCCPFEIDKPCSLILLPYLEFTVVTAAFFLLLAFFQPFSASAYICFSQRYQKLRKEHAKNALPVTPKVTATPTSAVPRNPKTPKTSETPEATTKSVKSTKAAGNKRKRAVSVELSTHDSDSDAASATINDEGDVIAKKVKVNPGSSEATIIKSVE